MLVPIEQLSGSAREDATHFCGSIAGSWDSRAFQSSWGASPVCRSWVQLGGSWLGHSERFFGLSSLPQHLLQPVLPLMSSIQDNVLLTAAVPDLVMRSVLNPSVSPWRPHCRPQHSACLLEQQYNLSALKTSHQHLSAQHRPPASRGFSLRRCPPHGQLKPKLLLAAQRLPSDECK